MADIGLTVPFTPSAGTAESRWLRLVQVGADSNIATMDEAADLIDTLYQVSPCETGTEGTGGEAADDSNLPDESTFLALSADKLGALCADQDHWDAQVDLLRSHPTPTAWQARSATATLISTDLVTEPKTETVTLDGAAHYDLEYPYHSGLTVRGAIVQDVRGSTVNFARPVTGRVRLTYTTRYERLTLRVPATPGAHGQAEAEPAAVIVFWGGRAAQIDLRQPETDDSVSAAELARLCRGPDIHVTVGGDCWRTIEHYKRCTCSDREAPDSEWSEQVATACPKGTSGGTRLGTIRQFDGRAPCPDEYDAELNSPDYYRKICCHYPPHGKMLPSCRTTYETYRGGAEIEGGADHWREMYGPDVRLVAVTPPDGICGTLIHEWQVTRQNCCDDITPLEPDPDNPQTISPGGQYRIEVHFGRPGDLTWTLSGGLRFLDGTTRLVTPSRDVTVRADDNICPQPRVEVDDGCEPLVMTFDGGPATPPRLSEHDLPMSSYTTFSLVATGGVPPYMWMASGTLRIVSWSPDGATVIISTAAGPTEWCVETVTVVDQCGQQDVCTIRNVEVGRWRLLSAGEYERCAVPGGGDQAVNPQFVNGYTTTVPVGGYYAQIRRVPTRQPGVCGAGVRLVTNTEAALAAYCASAGPGYESHYEDGVCITRHISTGRVSTTYINDDVDRAWQWVCGS